MNKTNMKKLALAGVLCAVAVVGSLFSFPVFGSKCSPVQHMVNILCAVLLGPTYGVSAAFVTSLVRNLLGLGSLMAFPGSMFGALLCGLVYAKTKNILGTLLGEVFGTAILGGCVPIRLQFSLWDKMQLVLLLRLHYPIPDFYCRWCDDICSLDFRIEKIRCPAYDARNLI